MTRKGYGAFNTMHRVVTIGTLTSLALACAYSSTASAQNVRGTDPRTSPDSDKEYEIEQVTVTASKIATPLNQTAKLITVISAKEIANAPVRSLQDLLVYVAGIDVAQRGAHGVQADISLRGGSQDQTMILLNGINLSNAETGHLSLDLPINLSDIERIEVLRGPSALIYGVGAFSGGINIITRHDTHDRLYASITAGMHRLRSIELRGSSRWGKTTNSLSASSRSSAGYQTNTDYQINNALWQTRLQLEGTNKIDLQVGYNEKQFGANSFYSAKFPMQYEYTRRYISSLRGELGTGQLRFVPAIYWDRAYDQFDLTKGSDKGRNYHRTDSYGANLATSYLSFIGMTTLAADLRREEVISSKLGRPRSKPSGVYTRADDRTNLSLSLEHTLNIHDFTLSAGALLNHTSLLRDVYKLLPSVNLSYHPTQRWTFSAGWSKSMRTPTFVNLWYTTETHNASGGLQPEYSQSFELSARYHSSVLQAYISGFKTEGRDLIDWVKQSPTDTKWSSWNHSRIDNYGIEAGVSLRYGHFLPFLGTESKLQLDYLHIHQEHQAQQLISLYALNYLRHKFTAHLSYRIGRHIEGSWDLRYQDRVGQSSPFATLDGKLDYLISEHLRVGIQTNNITDTRYSDIVGVVQPGFWLSAGISCKL
jgi:outer membrane receptor for transport of vitamin B